MPSRTSKRKAASSSSADTSSTVTSSAAASHASSSSSSSFSSSSHSHLTPYNCSSLHRVGDRRGEVLTFGSGDMAQLGLGDDDNMRERKKPTVVKALMTQDIAHVSAGPLHNAVITSRGQVWTWGCNDDGALGRSDDEWIPAPVEGSLGKAQPPAPVPDDSIVVQLRCGASHTVALTASGLVYAWGTYRDAQGVMGFTSTVGTAHVPTLIPMPHRVVMIAAGLNHDLALTEKGAVLQWGDVGIGQRSAERHKQSKLIPRAVLLPRKRSEKGKKGGGGTVKIERVFAGGASSFALTADGEVYSWGPNNYGQTGHKAPRLVVNASGEVVEEEDEVDEVKTAREDGDGKSETVEEPEPKRRAVTAASSASMGFVFAPTLVTTLPPGVVSVAADIHHSLFLTSQRTVYAVGKNIDGRLGLGHKVDVRKAPSIVPAVSEVMSIGVGEGHSLFVCGAGEEGGHLYTCGMGDLLQLGTGDSGDLHTPTLVTSQQLDLENRRVLQSVGGSQHSLILAVKRPERIVVQMQLAQGVLAPTQAGSAVAQPAVL